jgi:hypothetical protein
MILGLIFAVFFAALAHFFFYCHSAVSAARDVRVSAEVTKVAGVSNDLPQADDFGRLLQLVSLCPDFRAHRMEIRAVQDYYNLLRGLDVMTRPFAPFMATWTERERNHCSHFAAVMLEKRISLSRAIAAQRVLE